MILIATIIFVLVVTIVFNIAKVFPLESNYNCKNTTVEEALAFRYVHEQLNEDVCKQCHTSLQKRNPTMPMQAVSSPLKGSCMCIICEKDVPEHLPKVLTLHKTMPMLLT